MTFRYLGRPKKEKTIVIRPPFLRPEVSDGQITVKIMDNGIQGELRRSKSKGSLEITESQSADAEPPPPPKPDLSRYTGLRTHLSLATNEGKGSGRSEKVTELWGRQTGQGWERRLVLWLRTLNRCYLSHFFGHLGKRGCHLAIGLFVGDCQL